MANPAPPCVCACVRSCVRSARPVGRRRTAGVASPGAGRAVPPALPVAGQLPHGDSVALPLVQRQDAQRGGLGRGQPGTHALAGVARALRATGAQQVVWRTRGLAWAVAVDLAAPPTSHKRVCWRVCVRSSCVQVREKFSVFSGQELACIAWALRRFGAAPEHNAVFYMLERQVRRWACCAAAGAWAAWRGACACSSRRARLAACAPALAGGLSGGGL